MSGITVSVEQPKCQDTWTGQTGLLLVTIGPAIGLGNIWYFSGVAYTNGGDAFLIPYLVATLLVSIPMLWLDYAPGHKFRGSPAQVLRRIKAGGEFIGWSQVFVFFIVLTYYAAVTVWGVQYTIFSVKQSWGDDSLTFSISDFLQVAARDIFSQGLVAAVAIPFAFIWTLVLPTLGRGLSKDVEATSKISLPPLVVLFLIMVVRALFLPGAVEGPDAFPTPRQGELSDSHAWLSAFSRIFYSLSVGLDIILIYTSYLRPKTSLTGTAPAAGSANSSSETLTGISVFSALGFMASTQGVGVLDIEGPSGPIPSSVTFPQIVSMIPGGSLFGVLSFVSLVLADITSLLSLLQAVSRGLQDKFGLSPVKTATVFDIPTGVVSVSLFGTKSGLNNLDIVDTFIDNTGVVASAVMTAIFAATFAPYLKGLRKHLDVVSAMKVPRAWEIPVGIIVSATLIFMLLFAIVSYVVDGYGDCDRTLVWTFGWGVVGFMTLGSIIMTLLPWKHSLISPEILAQIIDEDKAYSTFSEGETQRVQSRSS